MSNKLVSVIMSTFNENEAELRNAIESILNQTYRNIEFLIVLDNPENNGIFNILNEYREKDKRIKLIINTKNIGLAESLNVAIKYARGEYIARMDADDISVPNRIEKQVSFLEENDYYHVVASDRFDIDENGNTLPARYKVPKDFKQLKRVLKYGNAIVHPTVVIRKDVLTAIGCYRNFQASQDYDLWLRIISNGYKIYIMDEKLLYYRIRNNSISSKDPYRQYLYAKYARFLFKQRLKHGKDEFSLENLENFLSKYGYFDNQYHNLFNKSIEMLQLGLENLNTRKIFRGLQLICKSLFSHKEIKSVIILALLFKFHLSI